jgi:AcrR family transcriptional regulator
MPRPRSSQQPGLTAGNIKDGARQLMDEMGTQGLSLREIARRLGVTAPAIYNYFPRLDDLITALIVDAYRDLADALSTAGQRAGARVSADPGKRLLAVLRTYRAWALEHPTEFTLIYGNPIPGYQAPEEQTRPEAVRGFAVILDLLLEAHSQGRLPGRANPLPMPPTLKVGILSAPEGQTPYPSEVVYLGVMGWYHIHGMIMLELFEHNTSLVSDTGLFYEFEIQNLLARLGLLTETN